MLKKKQFIGLLDGELLAAGNTTSDILHKMLAKIDLAKTEIATVYYGSDTNETEAEQVSSNIREQHPHLQVEVIKGGQHHYDYIISIV